MSEIGESNNFQTNLLGKKCNQGEFEIVGIYRVKVLARWGMESLAFKFI